MYNDSPSYNQRPVGPVPNYLVQSILATIFCCQPFGIVGIVFAAQVDGKVAAGDYAGAVVASDNAKRWTLIAFGLGLATYVIGGLIYAVAIIAAISAS